MKIAVTAENGQIFQHFGKTKQFALYEAENGQVVRKQVLDAGENGHGALAGLLAANGVTVLICGGIGAGARQALASNRIALVAGASGSTDDAVQAYLAGELADNPAGQCNHHHEGGEHTCGTGGCGHHHEAE